MLAMLDEAGWIEETAALDDPYVQLRDFRRVATRYDKLAANLALAAAVIAFWC